MSDKPFKIYKIDLESGVTLTEKEVFVKAELPLLKATTKQLGMMINHGLRQEWCHCPQSVFHSYPEDGECSCGEEKHHVHCQCGRISQTG